MMHDSDGKPSAAWALTTASTTSERSPGVMTATPSVSRSSTCSAVMPATSTPITSRFSSSWSPLIERAFDGLAQIAHRRRDQQRLLGQHVGLRRRMLFSASATAAICVGSHRLATTAAVWACWPAISARHSSTTWATSVGRAVLGPHRQHDRRAEVGRDAGVGVQLARAWRRRCSRCRRSPPRRTGRPRRGSGRRCRRSRRRDPRAAADSSTPTHLLVGQARGGVRQQQLEDVVAVLAQPGDGPEHPDLGDGGRQPVQDAERDRRLAGVALGRGDVDRGWHAGKRISRAGAAAAPDPSGRARGTGADRAAGRGTPGGSGPTSTYCLDLVDGLVGIRRDDPALGDLLDGQRVGGLLHLDRVVDAVLLLGGQRQRRPEPGVLQRQSRDRCRRRS